MGLVPPHGIEIEKAILGAILLDKDAIYEVASLLKPEVFYNPAHQFIYKAIIDIHNQKGAIDLLTVTNKLRSSGDLELVGGAYYISGLTSNIGGVTHIVDHSHIVYEYFLRREVIRISHEKSRAAYGDTDIFKIYNEMVHDLDETFSIIGKKNYRSMMDVATERLYNISKIDPKRDVVGNHTGYHKLDNITNGYQPGDFIILGARPSMGKTINAIKSGMACIEHDKKPALFFSLEMSADRIADRALSELTGIDSMKISSNRLSDSEWDRLNQAISRLEKLIIIDTPSLNINEIRNIAIALNREFHFGLIIIDYIQLIPHHMPNKNSNENVSYISRTIKGLGKECGCPTLALSQLKRNDNKQPVLSDLRDSGSLEQDADIVWLIHREDYEGRSCSPEESNRIDNTIAKNRNGIIRSFYTYRSDDWSYIGEIEYNDLNSIKSTMPFSDADYVNKTIPF